MESVRKNVYRGLITETEYMEKATKLTVDFVNKQGYRYVSTLGSGSFGYVIEISHPQYNAVATKVVLEEYVQEEKVQLWQSLHHENLLPLLEVEYIPSTYTYLFVMPKLSTAMDKVLEDANFRLDISGSALDRATSWLEDVVRGVGYLHSRNLCHLDLKLSNVLIDEKDRAVVCDFDMLTYTEAGVYRYASPFLFRPPEAVVTKRGTMAIVNGFKYDVYTLGLIAVELFTNQSLLKSPEWMDKDPNWPDVVYPRLFRILQMTNFKKLMKGTFIYSEIRTWKVKCVSNFVNGCLRINPKDRPDMQEVRKHSLFGGSGIFERKGNDVWKKKASVKKVRILVWSFILQAWSLDLPGDIPHSLTVESRDGTETVENTQKELPAEYSSVDEPTASVSMKASEISDKGSVKLSRKQKFLQWAAKKKARINKAFDRMFLKFRK